MSEEPRIYQEGETVPVPDKGGWIDGETGPVFPIPAPEPTPQQTPPAETPKPEPKAPAVPKR